jgi:predicted flap endonuclease-1-like 5' DNA nuclease
MVNFLNTLPNWVLAILALLFFLVALLYAWILLNWLDLRRRVFELQAKIGPLEAERLSLQSQLDQALSLTQDTTQLQTALGEFRSRAAQATRVAELKQVELQSALDEAMQRISVFEQHEANSGNVLTQLDVFKADLVNAGKRLSERDNTIANLTQQLATLRSATDSTSGMVATQEQQLADCYRQLSEAKAQLNLFAGRGSSQLLDNSIEDLRLQLDDTRSKLKVTNEHIAGQLQVIDALNQEPAQAETQRAQAELDAVRQTIEVRDATIAELKTQLGNTRTSLEMAHEAIQARDLTLAKQVNTLVAAPVGTNGVTQEFEAAKTLLAERDAQVAELEAMIADLEQDLGDHQFAWESVNVAMAERLMAVSELNMELDSLEGQLQEAVAKIDAQNATIAELTDEAKAASETLSLQQSSHDNAVSNLNAELQEARSNALMQAAHMTTLEKQLEQAQAELAAANARTAAHAEGIGELMKQLEAVRGELETARAAPPVNTSNTSTSTNENAMATVAQFAQIPKARKPKPAKADEAAADDLTEVVGIGQVYAKRLRKEGVSTFKALAKLKPAQLQKIISPAKWQTLDFESWIEQARERAKK